MAEELGQILEIATKVTRYDSILKNDTGLSCCLALPVLLEVSVPPSGATLLLARLQSGSHCGLRVAASVPTCLLIRLAHFQLAIAQSNLFVRPA